MLLVTHTFSVKINYAIFIWTAPPPAWNQTISGANAAANIHTTVIQVPSASADVPLRWSYTLVNEQRISITVFSIRYGKDLPDQNIYVVRGSTARYDTTRFIIDSTSGYSTLIIKTVAERDNATYQCRIVLTDGTEWAYNIRLDVSAPLEITQISEDRTVSTGDLVTLNCTAVGSPTPNITWTRLSDGSVVTMPLTIISEEDVGGYRCTADNGIGSAATREVFISLSNPPKIIKPQTATWKVEAGETVTIECFANGSPSPSYEWTNAAGALVSRDKYLRLHNVDGSAAGSYTCTAKNSLGSDSFTITIQMIVDSTTASRNISVTASNTPVPQLQEQKEDIASSGDNLWHIFIGIALPGLVILAAVVGIAIWCRRKTDVDKRSKGGTEKRCSKNDQGQEEADDGIPRYVEVESFHNKKMAKKNRYTVV